MSLYNIALPGSPKSSRPLQFCSRHKADAPPEGGVNLTPSKWVCLSCWASLRQRQR